MRKIKRNYIYNLIYQLFLLIVPIVVTPYLSRILLSDGLGIYSYTSSIVYYFTLLAALGFNFYAQRLISKYRDNIKKQSIIFFEILIVKFLSTLLSCIIYSAIVYFEVFGEKYTLFLWMQGLQIIAVAFDITFLLQGNEKFSKIVIRNIIIKSISIGMIFLLVKNYNDLWIYTLIQSLTVLVSNISLWVCCKRMLIKVPLSQLRPFRHLKPTLVLFIPTIAISIYTTLDKTMIGLITKSTSQIGNYDNAEKLIKMSITIISSLVAVFIPRNTVLYESHQYDELKDNMSNLLRFVIFLGAPMMFGIVAISPNIIPWYLGYEYGAENLNDVIFIMQILSPVILIIGFGSVLGGALLIPISRDRSYAISVCLGAFANLFLNLFLIRYFDALGAAIATIIAETIVTVSMFIACSDYIEFRKILRSSWKYLVSSGTMFVICFFISLNVQSSIIFSVSIALVGIISYFIILILLREEYTLKFIYKIKKTIFRL